MSPTVGFVASAARPRLRLQSAVKSPPLCVARWRTNRRAIAMTSATPVPKSQALPSRYDTTTEVQGAPSSERRSGRLMAILERLHGLSMRLREFRRRHVVWLRFARMSAMLPLLLGTVLTYTAPPLSGAVVQRSSTWSSLTSSFGVVFMSQFGDKSMLTTALMALRYNSLVVLLGALIALTLMTTIACYLGNFGQYLPESFTHYGSIVLFFFFGLQMILQSRSLPSKPSNDPEVSNERAKSDKKPLSVLVQVFTLIFFAEWLDRSMIATMALASSRHAWLIFVGASAANLLCSLIAVVAASNVATKISERRVALIGGILFEVFAVYTLFFEPTSEVE